MNQKKESELKLSNSAASLQKKQWLTPEMIVMSSDVIKGGYTDKGPEGYATHYNLGFYYS